MENAKIDENRGTSILCVSDDANLDVFNASCDPITDELLIDLLDESYTTIGTIEKIDDNRQNVTIFITDDINQSISPGIINPNNNRLLIDLIIN